MIDFHAEYDCINSKVQNNTGYSIVDEFHFQLFHAMYLQQYADAPQYSHCP